MAAQKLHSHSQSLTNFLRGEPVEYTAEQLGARDRALTAWILESVAALNANNHGSPRLNLREAPSTISHGHDSSRLGERVTQFAKMKFTLEGIDLSDELRVREVMKIVKQHFNELEQLEEPSVVFTARVGMLWYDVRPEDNHIVAMFQATVSKRNKIWAW